MEDDAAGLVLRLALKTRFSEMGWGSTPPSSAKFIVGWMSGLNQQFAKLRGAVRCPEGSNPSPTASKRRYILTNKRKNYVKINIKL